MIEPNDLVLLGKAGSIIERDALLEALRVRGIKAVSPARDMSRKFTPNTVDLSLEGYSAIFDGFSIYVPSRHLEEARHIAQELDQRVRGAQQADKREPDHVQRFFLSCIFSFFVPLVFHITALYHFRQALKKNQSFPRYKTAVAAILWAISLVLGLVAGFISLGNLGGLI